MPSPGDRYGCWVVVCLDGDRCLCVCDCGTERSVWYQNLRRGQSRSCGCRKADYYREKVSPDRVRGDASDLTWGTWNSMLDRCDKPCHTSWDDYGGRGIRVCDRWRVFRNFHEDMGDRPSKGHTLDRIDGDGDYEPGNCRWADIRTQLRNRRNTITVSYRGHTRPISEWAERTGTNYNTLKWRLYNGWAPDHIIEGKPK